MLRTGESFGAGHLTDILIGTATDKVRQRGHERPADLRRRQANSAKRQWQAMFRQMMGRDLIRPDPERHGALRMTEAARPILRGEETITLRRDTVQNAKARSRRAPRWSARRMRRCCPR